MPARLTALRGLGASASDAVESLRPSAESRLSRNKRIDAPDVGRGANEIEVVQIW